MIGFSGYPGPFAALRVTPILSLCLIAAPLLAQDRIYVTNQDDATVSIIDAKTHRLVETLDLRRYGFGDNAKRFHGPRKRFVFHAGMGHLPTDVAPDVRNRSYTIEADARIDGPATEGVLIAHGDMTCGYALYIKDNRLCYDMNVGGLHHLIVSDRPVPAGNRRLGMSMRFRNNANAATLLIDGEPGGRCRGPTRR